MIVKQPTSLWRGIVVAGVCWSLTACASQPMTRTVSGDAVPSPPPTQIYYYPLQGQSAEQQDKDRFQCYLWAKRQTGFDPSATQLAPHQRLEVIPQPASGHDVAVGAVTGAIIGSVVMAPHDSAEGMIVGAVTGAMIGAASDAARQQEAERIQEYHDHQAMLRNAHIEQSANNYRRAMMACLEGRGYSVR